MGADFIYLTLPAAKYTKEREERLLNHVANISDDEIATLNDVCGEVNVRILAKDYWILGGRRDVAGIKTDCYCYITGGLSWGDSPTDAYEIFTALGCIDSIYELLKHWATRDLIMEGL